MPTRAIAVAVLALLPPCAIPVARAQPPSTTVPVASPTEEARALVARSALRAMKQNWTGAEDAARAAIALDRTLPDAWHALARALAAQDRPADAAAAWEEALLRDPQHLDALEGLGRLYVAMGEREKADALLARLRPLDDRRAATLHHAIETADGAGEKQEP